MRVRRAGRAFAVYDAGGRPRVLARQAALSPGATIQRRQRRAKHENCKTKPILAEYAMTIEKKLDIGIPRAIDVGQNVKRIEAYQV
jgi:hypothetical protein